MEAYVDSSLASPTSVLLPVERTRTQRATSLDNAQTSRWATLLTFFCSDAVALFVVSALTYALSNGGTAEVTRTALVLGLVPATLALFGLYRSIPLHPAQELQRACLATTVTFVVFAASLFLTNGSGHAVLFAAWLLTVLLLPTFRILMRVLCSSASWWGTSVLVLGSGEAGKNVITTLTRWPEFGLKPVALLSDRDESYEINGVPLLGRPELASKLAQKHRIPYAIVAMPELSHRELVIKLGSFNKFFKHVFVAADLPGVHSLWTATQPHAGLIGYTTQHFAQSRWLCFSKRATDIVGAILGLILFAPLFVALAILIKLDSPGSVFFKQTRMGRGGRCFGVLKFRSMFVDAEEKLHDILREDPIRREEYELFHKLRNDPRITRVGGILRRSSLDELPQLLNVLKGDLSLVGPRAYMPRELPKMVGLERTVWQNRPGLTGLWQVSGRNELQFRERVYLDVHYMQSCSFWLDIYILIKTIPVVLTGNGAS